MLYTCTKIEDYNDNDTSSTSTSTSTTSNNNNNQHQQTITNTNSNNNSISSKRIFRSKIQTVWMTRFELSRTATFRDDDFFNRKDDLPGNEDRWKNRCCCWFLVGGWLFVSPGHWITTWWLSHPFETYWIKLDHFPSFRSKNGACSVGPSTRSDMICFKFLLASHWWTQSFCSKKNRDMFLLLLLGESLGGGVLFGC